MVCNCLLYTSIKSALRADRRLLTYGEPQGEPDLRAALCSYVAKSRNVVCTPEQIVVGAGVQSLLHILCGLLDERPPVGFWNNAFAQGDVYKRQAMEYAALSGQETVVDAYCGTGTIGLIAARRGAKQVVGVEINREAVRDAIANAKRNQIKNARFY